MEQESAAIGSSSSNIPSSSSISTVEEVAPCEAPEPRVMGEDELKDCMHKYIENWACTLSRDDQMSLGLALHYVLTYI